MASNTPTQTLLNALINWLNQTYPNISITIEILQEFCNDLSNPILPPCNIQTFQDILNIIDQNNRWDLLPFILEQDFNVIKDIQTNYKLKLIEQLRLKPLYNFHIFYTIIRWGNCELLDLLINDYKLDDYASDDVSGKQLDALISDNLKLLMLRRVVVGNEIKQKCEEILFEIRFITKESLVNNIEISVDERIEFILCRINELVTISEINSLFLLAARAIADNLFVLKNKVQQPLNQLPWGHMEFFIAIFLNKFDAGYKLTLTFDVNKLINYLILFKDELNNIKNNSPITTGCFDEFYEEFELNRSFLALTRIAQYMKAIDTPCSDDVVMRLAIERCVQVTGENLKSSDMSPNISAEVERLFEASAPNFLESIREMRNALSHVEYMESRLKIADETYLKLKKELKSIYPKILDFIFMQQYYKFECFIDAEIISVKKFVSNSAPYLDDYLYPKLLKACLIDDDTTGSNEKLLHCFCKNIKAKDRLDLLQLLLNVIDNIHNVDNIEEFFILSTPETRNYLNDLYKILTNKNRSDFDYYRKMLSKQPEVQLETNIIQDEIKKVIRKICISNNLEYEIFNECLQFGDLFKSLIKSINKNSDDFKDLFESIKNQTTIELFHNNLPSSRKELRVFTNQLKNLDYEDACSKIIKLYLKENDKNKNDKIVKLFNTLLQTIYNIDISNSVKSAVKVWLKQDTKHLIQNVCNSLKHLLTHNSKDELHRAALEMCNLDILELYKDDQLSNNNAPFYESYPILLGKVLRNHLAHYNILFDHFPNDHSLLLTANKLTDPNFTNFLENKNCRIGTINPCSFKELVYNYKQSELSILNQTKLFEAAQNGTLQNFQDCLRLSDIASNLNNKNVAIHATIGDNLNVFKYLLNTTKFNLDLKKLAIQHNSVNILKLLINLDGIKGDELHYAVLYNQLNIAEILLELVNSKSFSNSLTPLHLACLLGRIEMATLLIQNGADIEARDAKYNAPIHLAAIIGNLDILNLLLSNQSETDSFGYNERTAMHFAAGNGHGNLITALLLESTNINSQDIRNQTPLHLAAQSGYTEIASLLLHNGAKIDLKDADGNTPTHLATINKNYNTFQLFITPQPTLQSNNNGDTILHLINDYEMALLLPIESFVNCRNKFNRTPLHCAVINNNEEIVKLLVEKGANLYLVDNLTNKPMYYAKYNPNIEAILRRLNVDEPTEDDDLIYPQLFNKYLGNTLKNEINFDNVIDLLQYNYFADIESTLQKINVDVTPLNLNDMLLHAAFNGERDRVLELLDSGADLHAKFADKINLLEMAAFNNHLNILNSDWIRELPGNSALHISAWNNHVEGIQFLLDAGVDVNAGYKDLNALHIAAAMGHVESIEVLVENGSSSHCSSDGSLSPLQLACAAGHQKALEKLLELKIDIFNDKYPSPLHIATLNGHETIVQILLDNQADIDYSYKNFTPLHGAIRTNNVSLINFLVTKGADINIKTENGDTYLHYAIEKKAYKSIKALIHLGIGPNISNDADMTYLQLAALEGDDVAVALLLDEGADVNQILDSESALYCACYKGCLNCIKLLLDYGADVYAGVDRNPLHIAAMKGHKDVIKLLLDRGTDINRTDQGNSNPLHYAILAGHMSTVRLLVNNQADIHAPTKNNLTPLILAVINNNIPLIHLLMFKGADLHYIGDNGQTILHYALKEKKSLWKFQKIEDCSIDKVVALLIKYEADVNAIDDYKTTPLHLINKHNAIELIQYYSDIITELIMENKNQSKSAWDGLINLVTKHVDNIDSKDMNEAVLNELLLKNGANVIAFDSYFTALHYAILRAHPYCVEVLVRYGADIELEDYVFKRSAVRMANVMHKHFGWMMSICKELNDVGEPMLERYEKISIFLSNLDDL